MMIQLLVETIFKRILDFIKVMTPLISGYGSDIIRTKPKDTDANSNFFITDYSSYDSIEINDVSDLDFNNYWNDFAVTYSGGNTHIGITSNEYNFTNDSLI